MGKKIISHIADEKTGKIHVIDEKHGSLGHEGTVKTGKITSIKDTLKTLRGK